MKKGSLKKYLLPNLPYLFMAWACLKLGTAYRLAAGANAGEKLVGMMNTINYGQWLGAARPPSYKEQIRGIIDGALAERPADFAGFLRRMEAAGVQVKRGRGGVLSFRLPGQDRATRFRASTLGDGYGPEDVEAVIDGRAPVRKPAQGRPRSAAPRRVNLIIDIQQRMAQGKGPGYERWAKIYNLRFSEVRTRNVYPRGMGGTVDFGAKRRDTDRFRCNRLRKIQIAIHDVKNRRAGKLFERHRYA